MAFHHLLILKYLVTTYKVYYYSQNFVPGVEMSSQSAIYYETSASYDFFTWAIAYLTISCYSCNHISVYYWPCSLILLIVLLYILTESRLWILTQSWPLGRLSVISYKHWNVSVVIKCTNTGIPLHWMSTWVWGVTDWKHLICVCRSIWKSLQKQYLHVAQLPYYWTTSIW